MAFDFFSPNAAPQLSEYFLEVPDRKMVIDLNPIDRLIFCLIDSQRKIGTARVRVVVQSRQLLVVEIKKFRKQIQRTAQNAKNEKLGRSISPNN